MQVKFDFENIHDEVEFYQFYNELEVFCHEVLPYGDAPLYEADRLYDERVLVALVHEWNRINALLDECINNKYSSSFHDAVQHEWEYYSQFIAALF